MKTTPIITTTDGELFLGKVLSAWLPALGIAWGGFMLHLGEAVVLLILLLVIGQVTGDVLSHRGDAVAGPGAVGGGCGCVAQ